MSGLGDEGEGVGSDAKVERGDDVGGGEQHGDLQDPLHGSIFGGDHVHLDSLDGGGFWMLMRWI